jgi:hypothetical protein
MFPLQSVSFPATVVPLRVFEPRYVTMIEECLRHHDDGTGGEVGDGPGFGVVLIERGREVGGGDTRFTTATLVRIVDHRRGPDGGFELVAVAHRRIQVDVWLPDDPYPQALVHDLDEGEPPPESQVREAHAAMRRLLARCAEAGWPAPPATVELADDAETLLWHLCAIAPVGPLDDYALLSAPGSRARLELLTALIADVDRLVTDRLRPS